MFDLVPPILAIDDRVYLINARFLGTAVPRCLATEDWFGCLHIAWSRVNKIEVYCRAIIVLSNGAAIWRLHASLALRYTKLGVL